MVSPFTFFKGALEGNSRARASPYARYRPNTNTYTLAECRLHEAQEDIVAIAQVGRNSRRGNNVSGIVFAGEAYAAGFANPSNFLIYIRGLDGAEVPTSQAFVTQIPNEYYD